jgi:ribosomal protein L19E
MRAELEELKDEQVIRDLKYREFVCQIGGPQESECDDGSL